MYVFQYGSNTLDSQLNGPDRLNGDAIFVAIAALPNHKLSFGVWSSNRKCAAATLMPANGNWVWGALYNIPEQLVYRDRAKVIFRKSLDQIEGEGTNYRREKINVRLSDGSWQEAITYVAMSPKSDIRTSVEYVSFILKGLRERGAPDQYISEVTQIAYENNPDISAALNLP